VLYCRCTAHSDPHISPDYTRFEQRAEDAFRSVKDWVCRDLAGSPFSLRNRGIMALAVEGFDRVNGDENVRLKTVPEQAVDLPITLTNTTSLRPFFRWRGLFLRS
jgi:hypothetical protein